jgi:hypothetical protein
MSLPLALHAESALLIAIDRVPHAVRRLARSQTQVWHSGEIMSPEHVERSIQSPVDDKHRSGGPLRGWGDS